MKKYIKLLSFAMLTVIICVCFCSCKELDEKRDGRAFWGENNTVVYKNTEYKLLPPCKELELVHGGSGIIADEETPILLTSYFGNYMSYDKNADFIVSGHWDYPYDCSKVWCKADIYDDICRRMESITMDGVCMHKYVYDANGCLEATHTKLSDEAYSIVTQVMEAEGESVKNPWEYGEGYHILYFCDETMLFVDSEPMYVFTDGANSKLFVPDDENGWTRYDMTEDGAELIKKEIEKIYNGDID